VIEKAKQNAVNLKIALANMERKILQELERTPFFTGSLTISVQHGTVRTCKTSIEEQEHFTAK
jgi:hypothetical protein